MDQLSPTIQIWIQSIVLHVHFNAIASLVGWPGCFTHLQHCGGLSMVSLQLTEPLEPFTMWQELLPCSRHASLQYDLNCWKSCKSYQTQLKAIHSIVCTICREDFNWYPHDSMTVHCQRFHWISFWNIFCFTKNKWLTKNMQFKRICYKKNTIVQLKYGFKKCASLHVILFKKYSCI